MTADDRNPPRDPRDDDSVNALPPGTHFGELEILGTLGVGGFGIVYLARDHSLEREIAIKEYMPSQFALRDGRSHVSVRSMSMRDTFDIGRRSFVNEARLLARFDHPSLLKVYRFWEANGTAYMAMPRLLGQNLRQARSSQPRPPPEAWARRIFDSVLSGLEALHAQQVWHRDVAPDNIFLPADGGAPILLDFGAARQAIGDRTQVFTAILKPSFAPIEQYAEAATLKQGAWTDFYALAAVMHELLTGRPPPPAAARAMADEAAPLLSLAPAIGYDPAFLAALDWALRVAPYQRPQTAAAWRDVIAGRAEVPAPASPPSRNAPAAFSDSVVGALAPVPAPAAAPGALDLEFADTVQAPPDALDLDLPMPAQPAKPASPPQRKAGDAIPKPRRPLLIGAGVAAVLLAVVVTLMSSSRKPAEPVAVAPEAAASAASAPASAVARAEPFEEILPRTPPAVVAAAPSPVPASAVAAPSRAASGVRLSAASPASVPASRPAPAKPAPGNERAEDFRPIPRSPVMTTPEQAVVTAPVPASATPEPAAEARSPSEACGSRMLLAKAWCVDRQCERPVFKNHPECVKLRELRNSNGGVP